MRWLSLRAEVRWCSSLQLQNSCPAVAEELPTANTAIQRLLIFS
jgi:hypothetical protein